METMPATTHKRLGIAGLAALILVGLDYLQSAAFTHKLLEDTGLTGVLRWLLPLWLGPSLTIITLACLAIWALYPLVTWFLYPDFQAVILEIQDPDPVPPGPDLYVAIIMSLVNKGWAKSVVHKFDVYAEATNGTTLNAEIFHAPTFPLVFNDGSLGVTYQPDLLWNARTAP
jgi:hypothetical protein